MIVVAKSSYLHFIDLVNHKSIRALAGTYTVCDNVTLTIENGATCKFNRNATVERSVETVNTMVDSIIDSYTADTYRDVNTAGAQAFTFL